VILKPMGAPILRFYKTFLYSKVNGTTTKKITSKSKIVLIGLP
jgi:hypothetical protein